MTCFDEADLLASGMPSSTVSGRAPKNRDRLVRPDAERDRACAVDRSSKLPATRRSGRNWPDVGIGDAASSREMCLEPVRGSPVAPAAEALADEPLDRLRCLRRAVAASGVLNDTCSCTMNELVARRPALRRAASAIRLPETRTGSLRNSLVERCAVAEVGGRRVSRGSVGERPASPCGRPGWA